VTEVLFVQMNSERYF